MSLTPSNMMPLGTIAPDFKLLDTVSGSILSLSDCASDRVTVVMFICNHCPYVIHINEKLVELANEYEARGVKFIAISSNDVKNYPQDGPDEMKIHAQKVGYPFPYLYDADQSVAKSYDAACTPDLYVFDKDLRCVYRGQFDGARPRSGQPVTGADLANALDLALDKKTIPEANQVPSQGCNIKWI